MIRPYIYTQVPGSDVIDLHYRFKDLRKFIKWGRKHGDNGMILVRIRGKVLIYRGFGTIEHPMKELCRIAMAHNPLFDGPLDLDALINPKPPAWMDPKNYKLIIL